MKRDKGKGKRFEAFAAFAELHPKCSVVERTVRFAHSPRSSNAERTVRVPRCSGVSGVLAAQFLLAYRRARAKRRFAKWCVRVRDPLGGGDM